MSFDSVAKLNQASKPVDSAVRAVIVVDSPALRGRLRAGLEDEGVEVVSIERPEQLVRELAGLKAQLVIIDEASRGRETVLQLRAQGATFSVPLVGVLENPAVPTVLAWLRSGVTDLWDGALEFDFGNRALDLVAECEETRVASASLRVRVIAFVRRASLTGSVVAYPDTPFEGRATFVHGELVEASFGPSAGQGALEEMLLLDDAPMAWRPKSIEAHTAALKPTVKYQMKVLVVEDEPALLELLEKQLQSSGFAVTVASEGLSGLQIARAAERFDVMILDLNLPHLDGWGVLRALREDAQTRELPVVVFSAQDEFRELLKAARAGARAYVKKTGRSRDLFETIGVVTAPRLALWSALVDKRELEFDLRTVGPIWALRAAAELDFSGSMVSSDGFGQYEVRLARAKLVEATAQLGKQRVEGPEALNRFLASKGMAVLVPRGLVAAEQHAWVFESVELARQMLNEQWVDKLEDLVRTPSAWHVNDELATLFSRVASLHELRVLTAVRERPTSVGVIARQLGLELAEVERALAELGRRGVLERRA